MIKRTVLRWFIEHPNTPWTIEQLEDSLPFNRHQLNSALNPLVRDGWISRAFAGVYIRRVKPTPSQPVPDKLHRDEILWAGIALYSQTCAHCEQMIVIDDSIYRVRYYIPRQETPLIGYIHQDCLA